MKRAKKTKREKVAFEADSEEYEIWVDLINDIYNGFDEPDLVVEKIDRLLELVGARARINELKRLLNQFGSKEENTYSIVFENRIEELKGE